MVGWWPWPPLDGQLLRACVFCLQKVLQGLMRSPPDPLAGILAWICIVGGVQLFASSTAKSHLVALKQVRVGGWVGG